jgi:MFS family permease
MSTEAGAIQRERAFSLADVPAWLWFGIGVYALVVMCGKALLNDSDTYWQIAVGQWILDHHALPRVDIYSFTKAGEPWTSSSWLSQVLYATSYNLVGWTGPVVLAAACIGATFALLAHILGRRIPTSFALAVATAALVLSIGHFLARPHVLVLPIMLAWANGLMSASERGEAPSPWLLPLIALWANLHGGFVFGLVLVGAFALDALWNAERAQHRSLALRWAAFGIGALLACCATPYGWGSILAAGKILSLGELLHLIYEWMPADFSKFSAFEMAILVLIGGALYSGVKLTPPRIALVLGLLHMALSHVRNIEIFALLLPIVVLAPVASQFALRPAWLARAGAPMPVLAVLFALLGGWTWLVAANTTFAPRESQSPAAVVDALKAHNSKRVLNDLPFGGYLIWRQIPVFVDGRAELYGEAFDMAYYRAMQLKDVGEFLDILKKWEIDAVLLTPATPAVGLLDHIGGWRRVYADDNAVLHVRTAN